jgi:hypothetical protein
MRLRGGAGHVQRGVERSTSMRQLTSAHTHTRVSDFQTGHRGGIWVSSVPLSVRRWAMPVSDAPCLTPAALADNARDEAIVCTATTRSPARQTRRRAVSRDVEKCCTTLEVAVAVP